MKKGLFSIPAIISDIDGVIVRGKMPIQGAPTIVNNLISKTFYKETNKFQIPFCLVTNGGGCTEDYKAESLNSILKSNLTASNIILNFTPLRPILRAHAKDYVLVCGAGHMEEVSIDSGLQNFITIDELSCVRNLLTFKSYSQEKQEQTHKKLAQRGIDLNQEFKAIFILYDPIRWEDSISQIVNIVRRNDKIPIYVVNNDITYADTFHLPRLAFGSFTNALRKVIISQLSIEPNIIYYGKPSLNTFNFARENYVKQQQEDVGNFYMIGDNPKSDIRGANQIGWTSILVRTGVFHTEENDKEDPAHYVFDSIVEAYQFVLEREGIKLEC